MAKRLAVPGVLRWAVEMPRQNWGVIGLGADLAMPLLASGIGALRVLAVRRGAIGLAAEEASGGHTILKHIGQTEAQLRARLAAQGGIKAASTFKTLADAQRYVSMAKMTRMVVVLRRIQQQNRVYFVLTSYPVA